MTISALAQRSGPCLPFLALAAALAFSSSCGGSGTDGGGGESFATLAQEYVETALSFSPVAATAAGYHIGNGAYLNEMLDDYGASGLKKQREFFSGFQRRLDRIDPAQLPPEDRADYDIIHANIELQLAELETLQGYKHNPTIYVETIGNALFTPFVLDYAPLEERYRHITARLLKVPALLGQAKQNLSDAPEIWTKVAIEENEGNREMIVKTLTPHCPKPNQSTFSRGAGEALSAIENFSNWLKAELIRKNSDWRLGEKKYALKFGPALALGITPQQALQDAETELKKTRAEMAEAARPLYAKLFPDKAPAAEPNAMIAAVLGKIAEKHGTAASYFDDAKKDLEDVRQFIRAKGFVTLPGNDNLKIIETPVFMRGIYGVGGFNPAPPLMPQLGAFYWLTPITSSDTAKVESRLREYNTYGLKILTIHEALPGHYLQFEYANRVQPSSRRLLRAVFGNNPYIEGWAVYATQVMIDEGYLDHDPELLLTWHKQYLRAVANTILDIRLQTMDMTDQQAMDLMLNQTFQEREEATAKLQRAKLSSAQLPTYFTGFRAWLRLRDQARAKKGAGFQLAAFHEQALRAGAVPMPALERIINAPAVAAAPGSARQ